MPNKSTLTNQVLLQSSLLLSVEVEIEGRDTLNPSWLLSPYLYEIWQGLNQTILCLMVYDRYPKYVCWVAYNFHAQHRTREIYGISNFGSKQELIVQRAEIGINLTLKKGKEPIRYKLELQHSSHFVLLLALKSCR